MSVGSYSPHALLCGKVFCAHCGNRLNITSSGRTRLRADGSTVKEKRFRYKIDPEFQGKIPPLNFEEEQQLEQNILHEGRLLNPIIIWNGFIFMNRES